MPAPGQLLRTAHRQKGKPPFESPNTGLQGYAWQGKDKAEGEQGPGKDAKLSRSCKITWSPLLLGATIQRQVERGNVGNGSEYSGSVGHD